jgi:ADP-ribosylglycohydrolase
MLIRSASSQNAEPFSIEWTQDGAYLSGGGNTLTAPIVRHADGEADRYRTLATLAARLAGDGVDLRGCASCLRLRFSGMSDQFSSSETGYCCLVGFRNRRGLVRIEHGCGEHEPAPGWPGDLDAACGARLRAFERDRAPSRLNAFEGAIVGLAVGDALGFPAEFRTRREILETFGPGGITDFVSAADPRWRSGVPEKIAPHPAGTFSDDTQMSLAVAEALVDGPRGDLDSLMTRMASRFVQWSRSPGNDRGPGSTCMAGCARLAAGAPWRQAGIPTSKGCGSAMRAAPIGLVFSRDRARLLEVARASSLLTHGHDAAVEGAAAAALCVALALEKREPAQMYEAVMAECAPRSACLRACFEKLPALVKRDPGEALSAGGLGEGWVAEEAVASALYCFWRSPEDFDQTVLTAANTDGDSDSIACIAGGLSGAFNGAASIRPSWRDSVEDAPGLRRIAGRLCEAAADAGGSP